MNRPLAISNHVAINPLDGLGGERRFLGKKSNGISGSMNPWCTLFGMMLTLWVVMLPWTGHSQPAAVTLTDMAGREVILSGPAVRIVPTFKPVTLCVLAMGLQDLLVGIDTHSKHDRLTRAVFPGVDALPGVGTKSTGINLETVLSLKPDLVILYSQKDGLALAKRLEAMQVPSLVILPESMENIQRSMGLIAKAVGMPERGRKANGAMDRVMALVEERTQTIPITERKKAYFASKGHFFSTASGDMLQDFMFRKAGLDNVSHGLNGYFQNISPEQFIKWNPDIVFLSNGLKAPLAEIFSSPVLQQVSAIQKNRIHRFPSNLAPWDFPSPLSALGTLWVACRAYPHRFSDVDLETEVDRFHEALFGKSLTEMGGHLNAAVNDSVNAAVNDSVNDSVNDAVNAAVNDAVKDGVETIQTHSDDE